MNITSRVDLHVFCAPSRE